MKTTAEPRCTPPEPRFHERARFVVTFTPAPGTNGVRSLRLLLKSARRYFGLIAVDAREDVSNQIADAFAGLRRDVRNRVGTNSELRTVAGAGSGRTNSAPRKRSNLMDMSKFAGGRYLKAADVKQEGPFKATIVDVGEGKYDKPDLTLDDGSVLSANATSCGRLIRAYGADSDDWLDKEIEIYVDEVEIKDRNTGEMTKTDAVLVKPISPPLENKAPAKSRKRGDADDFGTDKQSIDKDLNDQVPF